jgi:hypothetical protein
MALFTVKIMCPVARDPPADDTVVSSGGHKTPSAT